MRLAKCDYCGKEIKIPPSREKLKQHFCSKECFSKSMEYKEELTCDNCGKKFLRTKEQTTRATNHYCSRECKYIASKKKNKDFIVKDTYVQVFVHSKNGDYIVLLDKEDWDRVDSSIHVYKKKNDATHYAYIKGTGLHRFIMNCPKDMVIDHLNHCGLDNRKSNLRICTVAENARNLRITSKNKSGCLGVTWDNKLQKWKVALSKDNKSYHGGYFYALQDAIDARKKLEEIHWKEKEKING